MRTSAIALLALLTACSTPGDVRRDGERAEVRLTLPPAAATGCLAKNADEFGGGYSSTVRGNEVIVRLGGETTVAVAEVRPDGGGSIATIWRRALTYPHGALPSAMTKGC